MRETLQALINLQEIDREIFKVQEELKRLPAEKQSRQNELDKRVARHTEIKTEAMKLRTRIKEIEDLTTTQRQRMRKVENEAAGSRADMALLVAYQHEIRTLKREISGSEEEGLELVGKVESVEEDAARLAGDIEEEKRVFAEFAANVARETAAATAKLDALKAERKSRMSTKIPPESLALYVRLLAAREGMALAELEGRICQACFMEIPTNQVVRVARGSDLVQCPSCDRILYSVA